MEKKTKRNIAIGAALLLLLLFFINKKKKDDGGGGGSGDASPIPRKPFPFPIFNPITPTGTGATDCPQGQVPCANGSGKCYEPNTSYTVDPCSTTPIITPPVTQESFC